MPVVLEVGPVTVRRLGGLSAEPIDRVAVAAALDGIDDPVALVGDRVVPIDELWCDVLRWFTGLHCDSLTVIHPSWWHPRRVDVVTRAARSVAERVTAVARRDLVGRDAGNEIEVVVEAGVCAGIDVIAVTTSSATLVCPRFDIGGAVGTAAQWAGTGSVALDVPRHLEVGREIRNALDAIGVQTVDVDVAAAPLEAAAPTSSDRGRTRRRGRVRWSLLLSAAVLISAATGVGLLLDRREPGAAMRWATVVEGRVGVEVPAEWTVQRVTAGPGSRRVQVTSSTDQDLAVHITQSHAPGSSLEEAAAVMERAIAAQVRGVFIDLHSSGERAGRPAVTYREVRTGRVIDWAVLQSGATRISIGCQSAPGREEMVRGACDQAVRSAREVVSAQ